MTEWKKGYMPELDSGMWPLVYEAVYEYAMKLYNNRLESLKQDERIRAMRIESAQVSLTPLYTKKLQICGEILTRLDQAKVPLFGFET